MDFSINTDTWFVICIFFIGTLSLFIGGYIAIPYLTRKEQRKRIRLKSARRSEQYSRIEAKLSEQTVARLVSRNQALEIDLSALLEELLKPGAECHDSRAFYTAFEKMYPSFETLLVKMVPTITSHELKLCAFIRMKLTAKEIARLMNVSPASVNKARYRLRKKMTLAAKDDLDLFIASI